MGLFCLFVCGFVLVSVFVGAAVLLQQLSGNNQDCSSSILQQYIKWFGPCSTSTSDWAVTPIEEWPVGCFIPPKCWGFHPERSLFGWVFGWFVGRLAGTLFSQEIMAGEWEKYERIKRKNSSSTLPGSVKGPPRKLQDLQSLLGV